MSIFFNALNCMDEKENILLITALCVVMLSMFVLSSFKKSAIQLIDAVEFA